VAELKADSPATLHQSAEHSRKTDFSFLKEIRRAQPACRQAGIRNAKAVFLGGGDPAWAGRSGGGARPPLEGLP